MSGKHAILLYGASLAAYVLFSGYGIDRGYPTALYALTVAIVEDRTLALDARAELLGYDRAVHDGRLYSDKAPGPSLLMIPAYLLARALTGDADLRFTLTLLLGLTAPAATAPLATAILIRRLGGQEVLLGGYGLAFASLLLPYATVGVSDPLAAALVAWAYALGTGPGGAWLWLSGAAAGFAVLTRYQTALLVAPLAVALLVARRRAALPFLLPLSAGILGVLAYNMAAFGSPLSFPTQFWRGREGAVPTLDMSLPTLERLVAMTFGMRRGLFLFTPVLLLAPIGTIVLLRRSWRSGLPVVSAVTLYFAFLAANTGWVGGADYGTRFSVEALPLLWALCHAPSGLPAARLRRVLLVPSAIVALLGALGGPHVPLREPRPILYKARQVAADGPRTILHGAPRPQGAPR